MRAAMAMVALAALAAADQTSFDCVWRKEVLNFAAYIQPKITKEALQQMADALNGADNTVPGCHVSPPAGLGADKPARLLPYSERESRPSAAAATTIYVDAVHGSDSNPGTIASPVETIGKGVDLSRSAAPGSPRSVILRAGYYYVQDSVEITPADSGLTIINYEGEDAVVSGAAPVTAEWTAFNVSDKPIYPSGSRQWLYRQDTSAVGGSPTPGGPIISNGTVKSWEECQANCQANHSAGGPCTVWTCFHNKACWFRTDDQYNPTQYYGDVSGYLTPPSPPLPNANIWKADLSAMAAKGQIPHPKALMVRVSGGRRGIRARYPNADPETQGFSSSLEALSWNKPLTPVNPAIEFNPTTPYRNNSGQFSYYQLGVGGPCEIFNPQAGYWCGNKTSGGGAFTVRFPSGMVADNTVFPHAPYADPTDAVVQTWRPGHWSSWAFRVGSYDKANNNFTFSTGGYQGARGNDNGDNMYIAGVMEEVDTGAEFFFDTKTSTLYLFHNETGKPPSSAGAPKGSFPPVAVSGTNQLFRVVGSKASPVKDVTISGLVIRDAGETLLNESLHGMPSGGDWALTRNGAVYAEGTEGLVVSENSFVRNEGNGVILFGYNTDGKIASNEFSWHGETCVALWGQTKGAPGGAMSAGMGPDATDGTVPTRTMVTGNYAREFGVWEKQSSFFFQAKSDRSTIYRNIAFNGPRANVNFNDGAFGGHNMTQTILFNSCRESGDHGPFNSWDRQVYEWIDPTTGQKTSRKAFDHFQNNMITGGYSADEAIDNDDGSRRFLTTDNAFYGVKSDLKSDFSGNQNYHHGNVLCYIGEGFHAVPGLPGFQDQFTGNTLVVQSGGNYGSGQCSAPKGFAPVTVGNNTVYTQDGTLEECGMSLQDWQKQGHDLGTTVGKWPSDDDLIAKVKKVLYV